MQRRSFRDDLATGERAENLVYTSFKKILVPVVKRIVYDRSILERDLQRAGADGFVEIHEASFDLKARDYDYYEKNDILLETISVVKTNKPGWLYKSKYVVYLWWNQDEMGFIDGYVLFMDNIRDFVIGKEDNFEKTESGSTDRGSDWTTDSILVPIPDFPGDCIQQIEEYYLRVISEKILNDEIPPIPERKLQRVENGVVIRNE